MALIVEDISLTKGPTVLLPRRAAAARIAVPGWPLLSDSDGRKRLGDRVCDALMLEAGHPDRTAMAQGIEQPAPQFVAGLLSRVAVILQQVAGHPVTRFKALQQSDGENPLAVWEFLLPKTGQAAGLSAGRLIEAAAGSDGEANTDIPFDTAHELVTAVYKAVGNSVVEVMLAAAYSRGISFRMVDPVWPMLAFGQGSKTTRMMTTITESDGHISTLFTQDKMLSLQVLRESGFPVPLHHLVTSEEVAVTAAENLSYPVVVKPIDQMRSRGVSVNLRTPDAVRQAFREAAALSHAVLVETQLPGLPFRILVIDGQARAAMQRSRPTVIGDGSSTVSALIEKTNRERAETALRTAHGPRQINVENFKDELVPSLTEQGLTLASIPEAGRSVHLAFKGETGRGGENLDVTEEIHPDNLAMAEAVAEILELSVLGLDFMTEDIARSYKEVNCGINEVNAEPALSLHMSATRTPRDVATPLFDMTFGDGGDGSIPIISALGIAEENPLALLEAALEALGRKAGIAAGDDLARVGRFRLPAGTAELRPAERILADTRVDCALVALAPKDFATGLAFDRCSACYLSRPPDHGLEDRDTFVQQAQLMATDIAETLILRAGDHAAWASLLALTGRRAILVSQDGALPVVPVRETALPAARLIRLEVGAELNLLFHHEDHVDRLATLDSGGDRGAEHHEALLLATAGLVALGRHPREIGQAITTAWEKHLDRPTRRSQQIRTD